MIRELLMVELTLIQVSSALEVVLVGWTVGMENVVKIGLFHTIIEATAVKKKQCGH